MWHIIHQIFQWYNFVAGLLFPVACLLIYMGRLMIRASYYAWCELREEADHLLKRVENMTDVGDK